MRRISAFGLLLCVTLYSFNAFCFTASYSQITTGIKGVSAQETSIKIKDEKIRMEVDIPQGKFITIINGNTAYQYLPAINKAYKMTARGPTNIKNLSDYTGYLQALSARVIGSESVGDYDCDIYEFIDPAVSFKAKAWVWRAKNFPVKYELDHPNGAIITLMKDVKINAKIDDSEFSIPHGVEIIEMSAKKEDR